jgi:hypothetical protein
VLGFTSDHSYQERVTQPPVNTQRADSPPRKANRLLFVVETFSTPGGLYLLSCFIGRQTSNTSAVRKDPGSGQITRRTGDGPYRASAL